MKVQDVSVAIDDIPAAAALVDPSGRLLRSNRLFEQLCPIRPGSPIGELVVESHRGELERLLAAEPSGTVGRCRSALLRLSAAELRDDVGEITVTAMADRDDLVVFVAPRRFAFGVIDELASRAHDLHGHGVVIGDGTRVVHVSDAAAAIYGRDPTELIGMGSLFGLLEPTEQERISAVVATHLADGLAIPDHFETSIERPDGTIVPIDMWVKATIGCSHRRTYALISDATERRAQREELRYLATHDSLTGLVNRHVLLERLQVVLERLRRGPVGASLCFIDLDEFKPINDRLGHATGDEVLRVVGARLKGHVRSSDTVARVGGDEFVVLFSDVSTDGGHLVLRDRLHDVIGQVIEGDGWSVQVDASVGSIVLDDPELSPGALLDLADQAMYEVKGSRRR